MKDYIQCTACDTEHAREDVFLDVSLVRGVLALVGCICAHSCRVAGCTPVRVANHRQKHSRGSPRVLGGGEATRLEPSACPVVLGCPPLSWSLVSSQLGAVIAQYNCDVCDQKVDAIKGLRFTSLPYILTLQVCGSLCFALWLSHPAIPMSPS